MRKELAAELAVLVNTLEIEALTYLLTFARASAKKSNTTIYQYGCAVDTMQKAQEVWMGTNRDRQIYMLDLITEFANGDIQKI